MRACSGTSVWEFVTYILNGFAFLIIGLELPFLWQQVHSQGFSGRDLAVMGGVISAAVILARIVWVFPGAYLPRLVPSIARNEPFPPVRNVVVVAWAGMRGAVSLAAALALPAGFPQRELLQFIAFCVILATLVGQGLTLGPLIKMLGIVPGDEMQRAEDDRAPDGDRGGAGRAGACSDGVAEPLAAHRPVGGERSSIAPSTSGRTATCPRRRRNGWSTGRYWVRS